MITRRLLLSAIIAVALASSASAQTYPDKPIKLIVPFAAGGPIDTMARFVAQPLSARLGQTVIVENRPGSGGTIGTRAVAAAEPDGYTLLFGSSGTLGGGAGALCQSRLRPAAIVRAGRDRRDPADAAGGAPRPAGAHGRGVRRLRQGQSGQAQLRRQLATPPHLLSTLFKHQAGIGWDEGIAARHPVAGVPSASCPGRASA